jgi:prepilin-type N-terminal cleavage/methylation domain-containing protein
MSKGMSPKRSVSSDVLGGLTKSQRLGLLRLVFLSSSDQVAKGFTSDRRFALGFTLIELLVAIIVSSLITMALLFTAVQLMGTNQREAARSDTQREVQSALDYIARDLREAIYVYDGECLLPGAGRALIAPNDPAQGNCPGLLANLPAQLNDANNLPVLAFWRVDPLPEPLIQFCQTPANARELVQRSNARRAIDEINCGAKRMYTLVVYSLNRSGGPTDPATPANSPNRIWRGRSRLTRYQLPKYTYSNAALRPPVITTGWVAPDGTESSFLSWPRAGQNGVNRLDLRLLATQTPPRATYWDNKVLVDFIDDRVIGAGAGAAAGAANLCPPGPTAPPGTVAPAQFFPTPAQNGNYSSPLPRNVVYACVRGAGGAALNQEVLLRIRANAAGRAGVTATSEIPLTMETRVLTRGVIGKEN